MLKRMRNWIRKKNSIIERKRWVSQSSISSGLRKAILETVSSNSNLHEESGEDAESNERPHEDIPDMFKGRIVINYVPGPVHDPPLLLGQLLFGVDHGVQ